MPTGQEAPWRGRRTTRMSWAKYLPPNCAPMPSLQAASAAASRAPRRGRPAPDVSLGGQPVVVLVEASFTTLSVCSAEVPPTTNGDVVRRAGRRAEGTSSCRRGTSRASPGEERLRLLQSIVLFAEPPPLATNRNVYSAPSVAWRSILGRQVRAGVDLVVGVERAVWSSGGSPRCRSVDAPRSSPRPSRRSRPAGPSCPSRWPCRCPGRWAARPWRRSRRCAGRRRPRPCRSARPPDREDLRHLLVVVGAEEERQVPHRLVSDALERGRLHLEDLLPLEGRRPRRLPCRSRR